MMTNEEKMYRLLNNILDEKPYINLCYDYEERRYIVNELELGGIKCDVRVIIHRWPRIDLVETTSITVYDHNECYAYTFGTENLNNVIDVLKEWRMDELLEGIEL